MGAMSFNGQGAIATGGPLPRRRASAGLKFGVAMLAIASLAGCTPPPRVDQMRIIQQGDAGPAAARPDSDIWHGEAVGELRAGAEAGDAVAAYKLGLAYQQGLGGAPRNPALAARAFEQAAAAGHPWAQYRLAEMYRQGQGVPRDPGRSASLLNAAASQGVAPAAYNLGVAYSTGSGAPRDEALAAQYYGQAAQGEVAEAQYNMGLMLMRGTGVPRETYAGLQYLRSAAKNGSLPAQVAVGRIYLTGLETMGQDLGEAQSWLSTAAGRGSREAQRLLVEVQRLQQEQRDFERALQMQQAETASYMAQAMLAAWLAPPPVTVVVY